MELGAQECYRVLLISLLLAGEISFFEKKNWNFMLDSKKLERLTTLEWKIIEVDCFLWKIARNVIHFLHTEECWYAKKVFQIKALLIKVLFFTVWQFTVVYFALKLMGKLFEILKMGKSLWRPHNDTDSATPAYSHVPNRRQFL